MTERMNHMDIRFDARSENEGFARMIVAAFMMEMNPTLDEMTDVKTAVSEAVTNAIIHGYEGDVKGQVELICNRKGQVLTICVKDKGVGIENLKQAMEPFFTTKPELERSGMGFAFMESFMDGISVESKPQEGTSVTLTKYIGYIDKEVGEETVQQLSGSEND